MRGIVFSGVESWGLRFGFFIVLYIFVFYVLNEGFGWEARELNVFFVR